MASDLEILRVLAKHAHISGDHDDAALIADFLEETAEKSDSEPAKAPQTGASTKKGT